ncbi:queuine tRNA-ribosyltransferase catalytic subunit [Pectinophora gossypiella]|uniref:queuine tRNA-ribosyltransferase catalytic subunit n=1 Tax=Pectinophora gossypiella TaxID=13191 RepID=UPI00214EE36F|nr:queuine tRNA-ribosyltransferase catalytic subunit [Pectinophora gossypiella]XP_049868115.1 queuine tRNA-ribosyltransferase catalytic subunit [Pectinophora gossypiella]
MGFKSAALSFSVQAECKTSRARAGIMKLPHYEVRTPVFMPVGTQGTMKGLLPDQLESLDCEIILGNTYHLGNRPGTEVLKKAGGLHKFMGWNRALLTDSGGFQMVSLLKLAEITEEGVKFRSPYDDSEIMLTPEKSIEIQNCIGADIIMQLDDVVQTTFQDYDRIKEATERTSRWLDRCLRAHRKPTEQSIFPIVQGLLNSDLRTQSAREHMTKEVNGFAIGGLSGGEAKDDFWPMVKLGTGILDNNRPRYLMGVGLAIDLVVCVALGVDMFDCVFPTRTARFGCALINTGQLNLKQQKYETDLNPIDRDCSCSTCKNYTRSYLHCIVTVETVACHLISVHNIAFQMRLMRTMRENIEKGTFPQFVHKFVNDLYPDGNYPNWVVNSLNSVGINIYKK